MSRFLTVFFVGEFCILKVVLYIRYLQKNENVLSFFGSFYLYVVLCLEKYGI